MDDKRDLKRKISAIVSAGSQLFFDDGSFFGLQNDDYPFHFRNKKRKKIPVDFILKEGQKVGAYVKHVIPKMDRLQFKETFRMFASTFETLLSYVAPVLIQVYDRRPPLPVDMQLLIFLAVASNRETYRKVSTRFEIAQSTNFSVVMRVMQALLKVNAQRKIVSWPTPAEAKLSTQAFSDKCGLSGIIGSLGAYHFAIKTPRNKIQSYYNDEDFHSIVLQAVCNENMLFLNCYAGEPGSMDVTSIFRRSNLFRVLNEEVVPFDQHIVGDVGYLLSNNVMVPFRNDIRLNESQKKFNSCLLSARNIVEKCFMCLKARFRRLEFIDMIRMDLIPNFIISCCILWNICLNEGDTFEYDETDSQQGLGFDSMPEDKEVAADEWAELKRTLLAENL